MAEEIKAGRRNQSWQKKSKLVTSLSGGKVTVNIIEHIL